MIAKEKCESRKKKVWELLSKFDGIVIHQKALMLVVFELVGDVDKYDRSTSQVSRIVKKIDEEEDEEVSEEEDDDENEACNEYVSVFWGKLESMFPSIQHNLWQLKQHGMDTRTYKESFGILTYTIWRFEQEEMKAKVETTKEWYREEKEKLGALLNRLNEFLARLIRQWKDRLQMMEETASFDRANYQVVYRVVAEEKNPCDFASTSMEYPANYKKRAVSVHWDFPTGCGHSNSSVEVVIAEEEEEHPSKDKTLDEAKA